MYDTSVSVGGITIRVVSEDQDLVSATEGALRPFLTACRSADVTLTARWAETPLIEHGDLLFDAAGTWRLLRSSTGLQFTFRTGRDDPHPYKVARVDPTLTCGEIELSHPRLKRRAVTPSLMGALHERQTARRRLVNPLEYPLDELLMIHLLSQGRGVEIHGCALVDRTGRVHLFAGQSGAGKSTMARLWMNHPHVSLLSDERVVLRTDGDRVRVYGTPWHGDAMLVSARHGELASVYFLNHAASPPTHDPPTAVPRASRRASTLASRGASTRTSTHVIVPIRGPLAAAKLLACSFLPFHSAEAVDRTIRALERATSEAVCHDLWFAPDASVVEFLSKSMSAHTSSSHSRLPPVGPG